MPGRQRIQHGFSLVEIVIGLTIMSVLVGVTVTTYSDSAQRAREQVAQDEARAIASSIQRWQLENQRPYPFRNVIPLVPRFLKNVSNDPWTSQYNVDTSQKIVYSFGPDGQDDKGAGDDVSYFYDTSGDVAPGPPQGLTVRKESGTVRVNFSHPTRNADGSKPVDDLASYSIYIRSSKETTVKKFFDIDPWNSLGPTGVTTPESTITSLYGPAALDESYYFTARAKDQAGNISGPSNQAGLFVAKDVAPRIVLFKPSSLTPPVSSAFSFFIEVIDADSNLKQIEIRDFLTPSGDVVFTTSDQITNPFRFVKNWAPSADQMTARTISSVELWVEDATGNTTDVTVGPITFVNRAPLITSLTPGIKLLTRNPAHPTGNETIVFTVEAADQEANMTKLYMELWDVTGAPVMDDDVEFPLNPAGAVMIRTKQWDFDVYSTGEYEVRVYAEDTLGKQSLLRTARVIVKDDTTPPDAMVVSLDPSNPLQRDSAYAGIWWNPSTTSIRVYMEAFEIESPPVTYQIKITERPFGVNWENPPNDGVTYGQGTSAAAAWYDVVHPYAPYTAQDYLLELAGNQGLASTFDETKYYTLGMRAVNSVNLVNITTAEPFHLASLTPQNQFRVDITPPDICPTCIEILGTSAAGFVWVQDVMSAEWEVTDYVGGIPPAVASGDNLYRYRLWRWESNGLSRESSPIYDWTEVATKQINTIDLPIPNTTFNGRIWELEVKARDLAGNWMTIPQTSFAKMDITAPRVFCCPTITNLVGGVVPVLDTFSANWGPEGSILQDLESGIESYEWGISTTPFVAVNAVPDVFGWLPVVGSSFTSGTISLNNLLTEGDNVHAVVRARNFAGSVSQVIASTGAPVNVNLFTDFQATPRTGLSPLSVNFTGTVSGGDPPFTYKFQFDGTSLKEFEVIGTTQTEISTSFEYDLTDASLPRPEVLARLIITDDSGRTSQKDVIIDLRDDLVAGVSFDNKEALYFFSVDGTGTVNPLFSVKDTKLPWGQMFIEPQGQFMVGIPPMSSSTSGEDVVQHAVLDDPAPGAQHIRINTIKGVANAAGPELSTMTFTPNVPRGTLVQTFNERIPGDAIPCITKGMIRGMTIDRSPTEVITANLEFGCDDGALQPIQYWGGVADPSDVSVGMALYRGEPPVGSTDFYAKRFDGVGAFPDMVAGFADDATPHTTSFTDNGLSLGPVPSSMPSPRVYPVATPSGYYLIANNRTGFGNNRIIRVVKTSQGFGEVDAITPDTPTALAPGLLDTTADGLVYATLLSSDGAGSSWSVGMGYVTSPTFTVPVGTGAGIALNLDIDDGGTRVAVTSDDGNVYLIPVINLDTKPEANLAATITVPVNTDIQLLNDGTAVGAGGIPSAVRFFRRPNSGQPRVTGVFSINDDSTQGDGDALSGGGSEFVDDDDGQIIVKGVNLDKVKPGTIEIVSGGLTCGPMSPDFTSLPPLDPYGGYSTYVPPDGDAFHYMRVPLDATCNNLDPGQQSASLRVTTPLGTSASVTTTSFTMQFDP